MKRYILMCVVVASLALLAAGCGGGGGGGAPGAGGAGVWDGSQWDNCTWSP
ncbi:MAG TPA: hypothetical protein VK654_15210 [Nitrospirota bacterium]|nr:hypothetical protein [Nitrospirota bacterium]